MTSLEENKTIYINKNLDNLAYKFNRFIITIFAIAPFVAYLVLELFDIDFSTIMQLLSYIGVLLLLVFRNNKNPIKFPKYLFFYLLFTFYVFYSDLIRLDREFLVMHFFKNKLIGGFNMMFIIANLRIEKKYFEFLIKVCKYVLVIAGIVILMQQLVDPNFFLRTDWVDLGAAINSNEDRLLSIYSWIGLLTVGFGFVPIFILIIEDLDKRKKKILIWIVLGISFAILTKARWILLNTIFVFVILFINHKNKAKQFLKYIFIIPFTLVASYFALNSFGVDMESIVKDRILESNKKNINQTTAGTRILAFQAFGKFYMDNPIFGTGNISYGMGGIGKQDYKLRSFLKGRSSQIHVGYLSLLYLYGLIGGILFLGFLYFLLRKLYNNAKITGIWAPFLGILGLAIANLTLVTFSIYEMGFIIVLVADKYYNQKRTFKKEIICA